MPPLCPAAPSLANAIGASAGEGKIAVRSKRKENGERAVAEASERKRRKGCDGLGVAEDIPHCGLEQDGQLAILIAPQVNDTEGVCSSWRGAALHQAATSPDSSTAGGAAYDAADPTGTVSSGRGVSLWDRLLQRPRPKDKSLSSFATIRARVLAETCNGEGNM